MPLPSPSRSLTQAASSPRPAVPLHLALSALALGAGIALAAPAAGAAEPAYPFEGTWAQPDHVCAPGATRVRTYTAKEVISPRGRCTIRRIAAGSGAFELFEECRHERSPQITETIRMTSPDSLVLRRQVVRLKIPRQQRLVRCSVAAPGASAPAHPAAKPAVTAPEAGHKAS